MKDIRIAATFLLTLAVWMYFDLRTPPSPLDAGETLVVAAVTGALVYACAWAIRKARPTKKEKSA